MSSTSDSSSTEDDMDFVHSHGEERGYDAEHGTLKGYATGFILSVILTAIPFWLVMGQVLANDVITVILVLVLGVFQIYVHLVYFLHIDTTTESGWQLMSLIFTLILVTIVLVGSIWVMENLMTNMLYTPISG